MTPVLFTHHGRYIDEQSGGLIGAISDMQAARVCELVAAAGQPIEYQSLPDAAHGTYAADPTRFVRILTDWAEKLPT